MPLTMRPIPHAINLGAPEIYGQGPDGQGSQGTHVLEDVNMATMVGTLAQLGALATYAQDMFDGLFRTADSLANQLSAASTRCSRLMQALPEAERRTAEAVGGGAGIDDNATIEAVKAERQQASQAESEAAAKVFLPEAMPRWLVERYHSPEVARVPDLYLIDAVISADEKQLLRKDGIDSCALRYSNPQFFYQEWYRLELERQEKAVREKKIKKEARKRRKAAEKAGGAARAVGEQTEESTRVARPARKSLTDWRGKLTMAGFSTERSGTSRSFAGDVSSLVGKEKLVVQQREAYADKFIKIEEEFADTGYQITPTDANSGSSARPSVQQLGALTVEDFVRKPETSAGESRRFFQPPSVRAGQPGASTAQHASSIRAGPQRPPPPQAPAPRPGASPEPAPSPLPPSFFQPPALPKPPLAPMSSDYSTAVLVPPDSSYPSYATLPPPPVTPPLPLSRPPAPRVPPPPPPPPPPVPTSRRPSFQERIEEAIPHSALDNAPPRPSYEEWGVEQPSSLLSPKQEHMNAVPPLPPPLPAPPLSNQESSSLDQRSSKVPLPPPLPPAGVPVPPPLPPAAPAAFVGQPPPPPPLPPSLAAEGNAPSMRDALLSSITGTGRKTLKPVQPQASDAGGGGKGGGGNDLLNEIMMGAKLNPVKQQVEPTAETRCPPVGGIPGSKEISAILKRREFLKQESDEDSDSDGSEWSM